MTFEVEFAKSRPKSFSIDYFLWPFRHDKPLKRFFIYWSFFYLWLTCIRSKDLCKQCHFYCGNCCSPKNDFNLPRPRSNTFWSYLFFYSLVPKWVLKQIVILSDIIVMQLKIKMIKFASSFSQSKPLPPCLGCRIFVPRKT